MSNRYKGAIISATPPTTTGGESGVASGAWTLEQQMQLQAAGLWPSQPPPPYIEAVFSTYLYTGNGATQTITNNINLSGKGGLVWIKDRTTAGQQHNLIDTVRGPTNRLSSNSTGASSNDGGAPSFNSNGFTVVANSSGYTNSGDNFVSWTFRKQPKFFDIVTYTGDGSVSRQISHNLGSTPGCIMVKATSNALEWYVQHRSLASTNSYIVLNSTAAATSGQNWGNAGGVAPTSTVFTVGDNANASGYTYVAYLFAHNAGGFGLTETDNVISCGSYTGNGSTNGPTVTLGYEPQFILVKDTTSAVDWWIVDTMRGMPVGGFDWRIRPNTTDADNNGDLFFAPTATGFKLETASFNVNSSGNTYIYIAIRRGPMAVPTDGTTIYDAQYAYSSPNTYRSTLTVDTAIQSSLDSALNHEMYTRLTGTNYLVTNDTAAQVSNASARFDTQTGFNTGVSTPPTYFAHLFRRAPSVHDVVCYTGTGVAGLNVAHNLGVTPELMIVKARNNSAFWYVYSATLGATKNVYLNSTSGEATDNTAWNNTAPTSTQFTLGNGSATNGGSSSTYVNYLFATCAGVSKVGSYTGTGTTQTINCGFTGGARFVLIKRTDSTGDWYVWDSARGIVAGNDPYLLLNTTAAQVTGTDYVDTAATGFEISSTAPAAINANGGSFIFLAIA